jgi:hypothetical protein
MQLLTGGRCSKVAIDRRRLIRFYCLETQTQMNEARQFDQSKHFQLQT